MKKQKVVRASSRPTRKVIKASRSAADMLDAFESKLAEFDVESATDVKASDLAVDDVVGWLADHDQAYADASEFFGTADLDTVSVEDLEAWISDHDQLWSDYCNYFGITGSTDVKCAEDVEVYGEDYQEKYEDVGGGFGDKGEVYSLAEIKEYWNKNRDDDPVLAEYRSFDSWWKDTRDNFLSEVHV